MKAFLLSAGKGERLGELTKETPKCLLPVGRKTMLEHWFYTLKLYGIKEVLVNTHHYPEKVIEGCSSFIKEGFKISFIHEPELLGSGKTVFVNKDFVKDDRYFLIVYTDTWMNVNLREMIKFQKKRKGIGALGVYRPKDLSDQGVVEIQGRKVLSFEEKTKDPKGKHAFAGIMIGSVTMFRFYEEKMTDLARDWLPVIKDGLNPYFIDGDVLDIGTPERYEKACEKVKAMGLKAL